MNAAQLLLGPEFMGNSNCWRSLHQDRAEKSLLWGNEQWETDN